MALIVEDGSIVSGANSYASVSDIEAYATVRGITYVDSTQVELFAIQSMDYLETLEYKGERVDPDMQELQWPRKNAIVNGVTLPDDKIPKGIKNAQMQLCIYRAQGIELFETGTGGQFVTREKIGPIETEYSEAVFMAQGGSPIIPLAEAMLKPYLATGSGFQFTVARK